MSEQKQPQTRPPMAEDTEPVDTAKALELIEAGQAAADAGAQIAARTRRPKKPRRGKPSRALPPQSSAQAEEPALQPENGAAEETPTPQKAPEPSAAKESAEAGDGSNGWQPSQPQPEPKKQKSEKEQKKQKEKKAKQKQQKQQKQKDRTKESLTPSLQTDRLLRSLHDGCYYIGARLLREFHAVRRSLRRFFTAAREQLTAAARRLAHRISLRAAHFSDELLFPYRILKNETETLAAALRDKTPEGRAARREAWRDYGRAVVRPLNRIANFFAPIFGLAILAGVISFFNSFTFALQVEYNGETLGYIAEESDFYQARDAMLDRLINEEYIPPEDTIPALSLAVVRQKELMTKEELTDAIMRSSGNELVEASGFYLEGKFLGALEDGNEFLLYMDKVLSNYRTGEEHEVVRFTKNIRLEDGVYPVSSLMSVSTLQSYLRSNKELKRTYTARPGETIAAIAKRYGLSVEEMFELNDELEEYLTALRQLQLGYDPDTVQLPESGTGIEEWNAANEWLDGEKTNGESPLEVAVNNGMILYQGRLYWPEDLPEGAAEALAAAAADSTALYRLQYGITAEPPEDEAAEKAASSANLAGTAASADPVVPTALAEDGEAAETAAAAAETGEPVQTVALTPLDQVPLQGDEELLVVQVDVELGIQVTRRETYTAKVPFGTTYQDNNKKPVGDNSVISVGIYGSEEVTADVTYIDGVRVGETVLNRVRTKEPVNQVISRGILSIEEYFGATGGSFIWPADGGYYNGSLGSYYGHTGMDIACPIGTTVRASKSGTVTTALNYGYNYGYGRTVVINHGYGQITRYAHMSSVTVSVGQYVQQGQVIGYSGNSGNSSGPHLHFEIRIDGIIKAPEKYIGYYYNR